MTTRITGIVTDLQLESAAFIRDLAKSAKAVETNTSRMARSIDSANRRMASFAKSIGASVTALASVQTLRSIARLGMTAIETADNIGAASSKIGIAAEDLQRFRFAAEQADVETGELDRALSMFFKNLATGKIKTEGDSPIAAFTNFIDTIRQAPTLLEKVRIAQEATGKSYSVMLQLAATSGEEFKKQWDGAHVILERAVATAGQLDNAIRAISNAASTGFATGFISAFNDNLGGIEATADRVNAALEAVGRTVGGIATSTLNIMNRVARFKKEHPQIWAAMFSLDFGINQKGFQQGMGPLSFEGMQGQLGLNPLSFEGMQASLGGAADASLALGEAQAKAGQSIQDTSNKIISQLDALDAMRVKQFEASLQMTQNWLGVGDTIGQALGTLFKDNKAVAIAQAVINTAQAITEAMKLPFPVNWAQVAAVTALGAAQIATISSTEPGSSKTISKSAASSGAAKAGAAASSSRRSSGGSLQQSVVINVEGESFGPEHFRRLVTGLNAVIADGATLRVS